MTLAAGLKEKPPRDTQCLRPHTHAPHLSSPKAALQGQGTFLLPGTPFPRASEPLEGRTPASSLPGLLCP